MSGEYKPGDLDEALDAVRESAGHAAKVGMAFLSALVGVPDPSVGPDPAEPATTEPGGRSWRQMTNVLMRVADALGAGEGVGYSYATGAPSGDPEPYALIDGPAILRAAEAAGRAKRYERSEEERGRERRGVLVSIDDREPERVAESERYLAGLTEAAWLQIVRQRVSERLLAVQTGT